MEQATKGNTLSLGYLWFQQTGVLGRPVFIRKRVLPPYCCALDEKEDRYVFSQKTIVTLTMLLLVVSFVGCEKEGTAERVGKKVDKTIEDAKKAVKE